MHPTPVNVWASPLAKWCVCCTFVLIFLGAIVTTSGAGMAAPTAPHVDGTMLNPISPVTKTAWWKDPALLKEHSHRLFAIALGLGVGALAAMLWRNWTAFFIAIFLMGAPQLAKTIALAFMEGTVEEKTRALNWDAGLMAHLRIWPPMIVFVTLLIWSARKRGEKPGAEQWMVLVAYVAACLQALVGTLRVEIETAGYIELATNIRTIHGVFAQAFLALLVVLAARLSPAYREIGTSREAEGFRRSAFSLLVLYFIQLALASYIRHRNLGLLISTWPSAQFSGGLWPEAWAHMDGAGRFQLAMHFLHTRIVPILILGHTIGLAIGLAKRATGAPRLTRLGWGILALVGLQITLGVLVIWRGRHPHITNTHVMIGALICATIALLYARAHRYARA
jgi:heme A synthase